MYENIPFGNIAALPWRGVIIFTLSTNRAVPIMVSPLFPLRPDILVN
jgi:hypothetical protein